MFFQPVRTVVYIFLNTSIFYDKIHEFHLSSTQLAQFLLYWLCIVLKMSLAQIGVWVQKIKLLVCNLQRCLGFVKRLYFGVGLVILEIIVTIALLFINRRKVELEYQ